MDRWEWAAIQTSGLRKMQTGYWIAANSVGRYVPLQCGFPLGAVIRKSLAYLESDIRFSSNS